MHIRMATSAGRAGQPNEDFVGAVPGAIVLLDGAGIPGMETICAHGVAWYTHRLGGRLLGRLSRDDGEELTSVLAAVIAEVADDHRDTCDITNPSSPQATVAIVRARKGALEYLLLADTFLVLDRRSDDPQVVTDEREVAVRGECTEPLDGVLRGTPEYDRVLDSCIEACRSRRNRQGGYWIAKDDPRAAYEAVVGSTSLGDIDGVALLSNGASRVVRPYDVTDWHGVMDLTKGDGPDEIIRRVRHAEARSARAAEPAVADDATVVHWTFPHVSDLDYLPEAAIRAGSARTNASRQAE